MNIQITDYKAFKLKSALQKNNIPAVKRHVAGGKSYFPAIFAICLSLAPFAWSGPGYLHTVGPVPLRFCPPLAPNTNVTISPRPASSTEPVAQANDLFAVPNLLPSAEIPFAPATPEQAPAVNQTNSAVDASRSEDMVSPQMLLKFFNKSTNGSVTGIVAPTELAAPRPTELPPSKATYSHLP